MGANTRPLNLVFINGFYSSEEYRFLPNSVDQRGVGFMHTIPSLLEGLAKLGHTCTYLGYIAKAHECKKNGVIYWDVYERIKDLIEAGHRKEIDVCISTEVWDEWWSFIPNAKAIGHLHNSGYGGIYKQRLESTTLHHAVCLSKWHYDQLLQRHPAIKDKLSIINYGLDKTIYDPAIEKEPYSIIFASAPHKGLTDVAGVFSLVQQKIPEAKLYFSSSTTLYGAEDRPEDRCLVEEISSRPGIINIGILPHRDMVNMLQRCKLQLYTSNIPDTFGLCLDPKTNISTPDGAKELKDINIGDLVLAGDGQFHPVKNKITRTSDTLKIKVLGCPELVATPEHPFLSAGRRWSNMHTRRKYINDPPVWTRADELQKGDYVAYPRPKLDKPLPRFLDIVDWVENTNFDAENIWCKQAGHISSTHKFSIAQAQKRYNTSRFVAEWALRCLKHGTLPQRGKSKALALKLLEEGYSNSSADILRTARFIPLNDDILWLIGMYTAEGSGNKGKVEFSLGAHEEAYAQRIIEIFQQVFGLKASIYSTEGKNSLKVCISSRIVVDFFRELCGHFAENKFIHTILYQSGKFLQKLVLGLFNGDGAKAHHGYKLATVSRNLAWQVRNILAAVGIHSSISNSPPQKNGFPNSLPHWTIGPSGGDPAVRLSRWLDNELKDRVPRNRKPAEHALVRKDYIFVPIRDISLNTVQEVMDIEVEGSHDFVGNGVLLHNCVMESLAARCPVLAWNVGGNISSLGPIHFSDLGDHQNMANTAVDLLTNEEEWGRISELGYRSIWDNPQYDWSNVAKKWESLFFSLLS